jgi:hypothetical protein
MRLDAAPLQVPPSLGVANEPPESPAPGAQRVGKKAQQVAWVKEGPNMPTLECECPRTERVVTTAIKLDEASYKGVSYSTTFIHCPHCPAPHRLSHVRSWLDDGNSRVASCTGQPEPGHGGQ